jgi:hypothetical protein
MGRGGDKGAVGTSFLRKREDRVEVIGEYPGLALVEFFPADQDTSTLFFVEPSVLETAASKDDPVEYLTRDRKIRRYTMLPKSWAKILVDTPIEIAMNEHGFYDGLKQDIREELTTDGFDPDRVVAIEWSDHSFWKLGQEMPLTRPYWIDAIVGVTEEHFDLDKAREILEAHPWVLGVKDDNRRYGHHGNPQGLHFVLLLPQEEHDKMAIYSNRRSTASASASSVVRSIPPSKSTSPFDLKLALIHSAKKGDLGEGHYPLGKDPLGLAPAVLAEPREDTYDRDGDW